MKDIVGAWHSTKTKKDKKGKVVASSTEAPSPTPARRPIGITIREPATDVPAGGAEPTELADPKGKGKRQAEGRPPSSQKCARAESDVPLIPLTPESSKFDPILVLNNALSFEATSRRDELAWVSMENESDSTMEASRYLLGATLRVWASHVSRGIFYQSEIPLGLS